MPRIAVFGGSFNPPGLHHRAMAVRLAERFDKVVVVPCGPRPDKATTNDVDPVHRATMVDMTFRGLSKVEVALFDLEHARFTRTWELDERYASRGEVYHVVGTDLIEGGAKGTSDIQRSWARGEHLWSHARFAVVERPGYAHLDADLPPKAERFGPVEEGSSSAIRERIFKHQPIGDMVTAEVSRYIERYGLYKGRMPLRSNRFVLDELAPLVVADRKNALAREIAERFPSVPAGKDPTVILVIGGDGTMLHAIRKHWRLRLPFMGINAGHLGFLHNELEGGIRPEVLQTTLKLHQLPLLWVETEDIEGIIQQSLAFNDAWVERMSGQTAWIRIEEDGEERIAQLMCDGALLSTAAGSPAYARAMGATPVPIGTPVLLLVGSNVLRPAGWKHAVLPLDSEVSFKSLNPTKRPLRGYVDGIDQGEILRMTARVSRIAAAELLFLPGYDMAAKLARIQFPESTPL